ncbi:MAG: helix-turn-helix transcriptional regulator [Lachnospiraceae bacterium]|nr:helix-turn-helix transcriptional regulator [Lachnospiraceae bacterium]
MKIYTYNGRNNLCGQQVRLARLEKHLTQQELAAKLQTEGIEIERDSVSRIEIGTRFVADYELKKLSEVLEVSVDWLLEEGEEEE